MRRQWKLYLLALSLVLVVSRSASAQRDDGVTFTTIDFPGAAATQTLDINAPGEIVGRYVDANGKSHGWLLSEGSFTTIDFPGAVFTGAAGINSRGDIVGAYLATPGGPFHSFLLREGEFTPIDVPGATGGTFVFGINARGEIVGSYCTDASPCGLNSGTWHGFVLREGELTSFDFPDAIFTIGLKIDARGDIVGRYRGTDGNYHGYLLSGGDFTAIDFPGAACTIATGVNHSDIVGRYTNVPPCSDTLPGSRGFLLSGGDFTMIDFPGALFTFPFAINPRGDIVGQYCDIHTPTVPCTLASSGNVHGFLRSAHQNDDDKN